MASGISEAQTNLHPVGPDGKPRPKPALPHPSSRTLRPTPPPAADTRPPKPLIPRQIKANPETYLGRPIRVAGQPTLKQDTVTGKWIGTSDGMAVEATPDAYAYYQRMKPKGKRPVFNAELVRRGGDYVLIYKSGIEPGK